MDKIMTPDERTLVRLEEQYISIVKKLDALPQEIEKMIAAAIDRHVLDCINSKRNKQSYPPSFFSGMDPKLKARLVNTIIAVLSTGGTILAMKFGFGG
jgi:hypothetical protein